MPIMESSSGGGGGGGAVALVARIGPLAVAQAAFDFTNIAPYHALFACGELRSTKGAVSDFLSLTLNGDTAAHYEQETLMGENATATAAASLSNAAINASVVAATTAAGRAAGVTVWIPNANGSTFGKTVDISVVFDDNVTPTRHTAKVGGFWNTTAAVITEVKIACAGGNWDVGSVMALYGYALA